MAPSTGIAFAKDIHLSTHFLDNIIDVNRYPLPEIDALAKRIRRIGLGVMGFADALVRLGIPYDSAEGVEFGRKVMEFLDVEGKKESERLAADRGAFPEWAQSIWGPDATGARDESGARIRPMQALRNCNVTTVAPTGTISIIAGCSSGLEPLFAVAFMRNQAGVRMPDVNEDFTAIAKAEGWYSAELMERIANQGHIGFPEVPAKWQRVFVTANAIAPEWHIKMQAAVPATTATRLSQRRQTSRTPRLKRTCARSTSSHTSRIARAARLSRRVARQSGALHRRYRRRKGRCCEKTGEYRVEVADLHSAIMEKDVLEIERLKKALFDAEAETLQRRQKRARPDTLRSTSIKKETPLGVMFVHITEDDKGQPFEVFINLGKAGGGRRWPDAEAVGRLMSLALRSGISLQALHRQLRVHFFGSRGWTWTEQKLLSVPDAIGLALEDWMKMKQGVQQSSRCV